jgi:hypothetical protein
MEQGILKIAFEDEPNALESYYKLVECDAQHAPSYLSVSYRRREFRARRKNAEDSLRSGRPRGLRICLRAEHA